MYRLFAIGILHLGQFFAPVASSGQDTDNGHFITLWFHYGSRPKMTKDGIEAKSFGGKLGGHVLIQIDTQLFSFYPVGRFHVFPKDKKKHSKYFLEDLSDWASDTATEKYTSIIIPLTDSQYNELQAVKIRYLSKCPYDYAFFGMRCAAAANDVLSYTGIVKKQGGFMNVLSNFYPQPFRQKMLKYAIRHNLKITKQDGRDTRFWEKDYVGNW